MKQADMPHVQPLVVVQLMVLLGLANGTPVIAKKILGTILARPLDGGMNLADGQPLFGDSKTSDHLGRALGRPSVCQAAICVALISLRRWAMSVKTALAR